MTDDKPDPKKDEDLLKLARERYTLEKDINADLRVSQVDDIKFKAGDQWPTAVKSQRENDPYGARPCLVINHARTHANAVINAIRQNRPQIKVLPVDNGADPETAEMMNGLLRHIQVSGDADLAYDHAMTGMVDCGEGYFEVVTVQNEDGSQEVDIEPIMNGHAVHLDPYHENPTGSDAMWCFVDDPKTREELEEEFPGVELTDWDSASNTTGLSNWYLDEKRINAARYWYKEVVEGVTTIHALRLTGDKVLERSTFPGKYMPIIRVAGEEVIIEGKRDVKGLIRDIKDPCRMYNYWASVNTERIALSPKAPFIGEAEAFEGHEKEFELANTANIPFLKYKGTDAQGNRIPPPQRSQPVQQDTAIIQAMLQAHDDIKAISGKFDASLGNRSNETSGVAIRNRDRQGDTLTFHFPDNLNRAIRQCGRVLVGLIPILYAEERIVRILGEDDSPDFAQISPTGESFREVQDGSGKMSRIYDLGVGTYDVTVKAGPSFSTRRQESVEEMSELLARNPQAFQLIGHKLIKNMDWPGADEAAEILEAMLPPEVKAITDAKKEGGDQVRAQVEMAQKAILDQVEPAMQQLQEQVGQATQAANQVTQENQMLKIEIAKRGLKEQELQMALRDKQGELQIEAEKVRADSQAKQQDAEAKIVIAAMAKEEDGDEKPEQWTSNTVAAQAAEKAVEQMHAMSQALEQQTQEITEVIARIAAQSAQESARVSDETSQVASVVVSLQEHIEQRAARDATVQSAVLGFFKSGQSDQDLAATLNKIEKL